MTEIISSTVLRNNYNEVSRACKEGVDAYFITRNGNGDLAVMDIDRYRQMTSRLEFYEFLLKGHRDVQAGAVLPASEASSALREKYGF